MSENGPVRCKRCNRVLTDPNSIKHQLGQVCYNRLFGVDMPGVGRPSKPTDDNMISALEWFR